MHVDLADDQRKFLFSRNRPGFALGTVYQGSRGGLMIHDVITNEIELIKTMMQSVVNEYKRIRPGQLVPPEDNAILRLNETYFSIWVADQDRPGIPVLTDEILLEEKILEM